jgi:hypothetical protein
MPRSPASQRSQNVFPGKILFDNPVFLRHQIADWGLTLSRHLRNGVFTIGALGADLDHTHFIAFAAIFYG